MNKILEILEHFFATHPHPAPLSDTIAREYAPYPNAFLILISCLLSLRARDSVTVHLCRRLFARARTPEELLAIPREELEILIYQSGTYRQKAATLHAVSAALIQLHRGIVPATRDELEALPGVGPKTATLVLSIAFGIPAICVDTHVARLAVVVGFLPHRLSPEETEHVLMQLFPREEWSAINRLLVTLGQTICTPPVAYCSRCPLSGICPRRGVKRQK